MIFNVTWQLLEKRNLNTAWQWPGKSRAWGEIGGLIKIAHIGLFSVHKESWSNLGRCWVIMQNGLVRLISSNCPPSMDVSVPEHCHDFEAVIFVEPPLAMR